MKFALISQVLPPSWSGQAIVLYRLLQNLRPDDYCLLSRQEITLEQKENSRRLPGRYYHLPAEGEARRRPGESSEDQAGDDGKRHQP